MGPLNGARTLQSMHHRSVAQIARDNSAEISPICSPVDVYEQTTEPAGGIMRENATDDLDSLPSAFAAAAIEQPAAASISGDSGALWHIWPVESQQKVKDGPQRHSYEAAMLNARMSSSGGWLAASLLFCRLL